MLNVQLLNLSNEVVKLDLVEIYDDFLRKIGSRAIHIDFKDICPFILELSRWNSLEIYVH